MEEILNYSIVHIGSFELKVLSLVKLLAYLIAIFIFLQFAKKIIYRPKRMDISRKFAIYSLFKYVTFVFAIIFGMQILGFNLSVLLAGSAALLVGVGLGLQNLFSDFVSGIIILVESSVKVGDVIEVNGLVCKVQIINLRTTTVLTREDKYIILPNSDLTRNQLINWTHSNVLSRFEIAVGVDYSSDVSLVMRILKQAAVEHKSVLREPKPSVRFDDYGDSSLKFLLFFWSEEVFRVENVKSEIRVRIFELFRENNVTIPFPQRVVHLSKE
ncbi:MAG TPA: mechanosensitive ion channel [Bacteroidia bacterium]|nr:mechanosensitive ion channel [Bacteroidia bacterium]